MRSRLKLFRMSFVPRIRLDSNNNKKEITVRFLARKFKLHFVLLLQNISAVCFAFEREKKEERDFTEGKIILFPPVRTMYIYNMASAILFPYPFGNFLNFSLFCVAWQKRITNSNILKENQIMTFLFWIQNISV